MNPKKIAVREVILMTITVMIASSFILLSLDHRHCSGELCNC